jgi:hypothetical protein
MDPITDDTFICTTHAAGRAQQRGVTLDAISLTVKLGERTPNGERYRVRCTERALAKMRRAGVPPTQVERASGTSIIRAPDGWVITVLPKRHHRHARVFRDGR